MADYATTAEVRLYGYQSLSTDEPLLNALITRASRLFDNAAGKPKDYFGAAAASPSATARKFWGNGTDYLRLDPYLIPAGVTSITTVAMPTGFTVPGYLEANHHSRAELNMPGEFCLVRTYGDNESRFSALSERGDLFPAEFSGELDYVGWPDGIKVTVTAKWGWDAVPEDVKEATIETVIAIWRGRDAGFARAVGVEGAGVVIGEALPQRAREVAERYRAGRFAFA